MKKTDYATFLSRVLAFFVDTFIFFVVGFVVSVVVHNSRIVMAILLFGFGIAYHTYFIFKNGQTPGKFLLKIKVVNFGSTTVPTMQVALIRSLGFYLPSLFSQFVSAFGVLSLIDCLWMLWDKDKQTLHDKVAKTAVVKA